MMMKAVFTSGTSVCFNGTSRRYTPQGCHLNIHCRETLKPNVVVEWFTLLLRIREVPWSNLDPETGILIEVIHGFLQSLQANVEALP
jgi:hypothetical protein